MRFLLVVKQQRNVDAFVETLRLLAGRGHSVTLAVQDADDRRNDRLSAAIDAAGIAVVRCPAVRTDAWKDPEVFPARWPRLEPGFAGWLRERGVTLVGLDVPSVDALESKGLPIHAELNRAGILILESLDLRGVEPGDYELIAAPLRIAGGDASPVRALLRKP